MGIVDRCPSTMDIEELIAILQYQEKNGTKVAKTKRANINRSIKKKEVLNNDTDRNEHINIKS
jgi:hypothetical protein